MSNYANKQLTKINMNGFLLGDAFSLTCSRITGRRFLRAESSLYNKDKGGIGNEGVNIVLSLLCIIKCYVHMYATRLL